MAFMARRGKMSRRRKVFPPSIFIWVLFPFFCFAIAKWIKDLLRLIIEFKAAVCFLSCLKFDYNIFLLSLGRDELIWWSSALLETLYVFEPAPWINVLINKIWVPEIRAEIPNATKSVTVSSFYWSFKKKKNPIDFSLYVSFFCTPYPILGFQHLYISEQFKQVFYLLFVFPVRAFMD